MTFTRTFSFAGNNEVGILYLVSTPIGNLCDMSARAIEILKEVHLIAAEDTRHTRKLLTHFQIEGPGVISYHEHNKYTAIQTILATLEQGKHVACVTDAGTPGISDPGQELVQAVRELGWPVSSIPGPTAAIAALIISGLPTNQFSFVGFLSRTKKVRRETLEKWKVHEETLLFYEAPHRVKDTLKDLAAVFGEHRRIAAVRELTKKFEEVITGTLGEVASALESEEIRGEWVLVVEGSTETGNLESENAASREMSLKERVVELLEAGVPKKEAVKQVAKERGLSRNEVYQEVLDL